MFPKCNFNAFQYPLQQWPHGSQKVNSLLLAVFKSYASYRLILFSSGHQSKLSFVIWSVPSKPQPSGNVL